LLVALRFWGSQNPLSKQFCSVINHQVKLCSRRTTAEQEVLALIAPLIKLIVLHQLEKNQLLLKTAYLTEWGDKSQYQL